MSYPWEKFSLLANLGTGPKEVTIQDKHFTCYTAGTNGQFFATCATDLTVYSVDLDGQTATPVSLSTARPVTVSAWHVSAQNICARAARVPDLNEEIARLAISTHFATGLVTEVFAEELVTLILEHVPTETELAAKLAKYNGDMPGSPRRLAACTSAVLLLAPLMES